MSREEVEKLRASRTGQKSWITRSKKYTKLEEEIEIHPHSDPNDLDKDVDDIIKDFFDMAVAVEGLRSEYEKQQQQITAQNQQQQTPASTGGQGQAVKNKIHHSKPETLQEETDLKDWIRWMPTWKNYIVVTELANQPREIQVGTFWECCSPGFLNTVQNSLGIKLETARPLNEIHKIIEDHLRSLRDQNIDMKTLLEVRKDRGQDYMY